MQRIHRFLSSAYPTGLPPPERCLSGDTAIRPFQPGHANPLIFLRAIGNPYKNRIFATLASSRNGTANAKYPHAL